MLVPQSQLSSLDGATDEVDRMVLPDDLCLQLAR